MIYQAFKYRIYPNAEQKILLSQHFGAARWAYNYALSKKIISYQTTGKGISRFEIHKDLPILKKQEGTLWLNNVNAQSLQSSMENVDKAFTKFFREKKGFPCFKSKKNNRNSFSIPQRTEVNFNDNSIKIPKFNMPIKAILHRRFDGVIKTSTISRTPTDKYFISIIVQIDKDIPTKEPISENQAVGIDLGIKTFAILSNGDKIENPKYLRKAMMRLKRQQRRVSHTNKGSNNRKRAALKLACIYEKVTNKRNDFLHKVTIYLIKSHNTLCLETLNTSKMIKDHRLAQAFSDVSIGRFNELLNYKAEWHGKNILRIGQFEPSSKMCSCGTINNNLKLSDRIWTCPICNVIHDRDILAANNIKRFAFNKNCSIL